MPVDIDPDIEITDKNVLQVWDDLEKKFGVKYNKTSLTLHDGTVLKKENFGPLESGLRFKLKHPELAHFITTRFADLVSSLKLPKVLVLKLDRWFYEHAHLLGSKKVPALGILLNHGDLHADIARHPELREGLLSLFTGIQEFLSGDYHRNASEDSSRKMKVLIITTSGFGGGHFSSADAASTYLKSKYNDIDVVMYDTKKQHQDKDVMYRATGSFHAESIYDDILIKDNNQEKALAYWSVLSTMKHFIPDRSIETLMTEVRNERPDLILSFIHNRPEYISLSYSFDIPLHIVSTDFELQHLLYEFVQSASPKLVRILASTKHTNYFQGLFEFTKKPFMKGFFADTILKGLEDYLHNHASWDGFKRKAPIFDVMGIPVRKEIVENRDPSYLAQIRRKYNLDSSSKVITIAMGKQGGGNVEQIVKEISEEESSFTQPVDFFVVCGKNKVLASKIRDFSKTFSSTNIKFHVHEFLNASEVSDLLNLSHFLISKPGGATTAEVLETNTPLLAYSALHWEKANFDLLRDLDLGFSPSELNGFIPAIHHLLSREKPSNSATHLRENWKENLDRHISAIKKSLISHFDLENENSFYIVNNAGEYLTQSKNRILRFSSEKKTMFKLRSFDDGTVSIQSERGDFLSARENGSVSLVRIASGWEAFRIEEEKELRENEFHILFKSFHGNYLHINEQSSDLELVDRQTAGYIHFIRVRHPEPVEGSPV